MKHDPTFFVLKRPLLISLHFLWQRQCESSGQVDGKSALSIVDNVVIFYHMMKIEFFVDIYHRIILISTSKRLIDKTVLLH